MTLPNQSTSTTNAGKLAGKLLAGGARYRREGNVVADIVLLMSELRIDHLDIEREYPIGRGQADIYLPRYRTIIEAKATGKAAHPNEKQPGTQESPVEQLERYILAEISSERDRLPFDGEEQSNREWTGIITDGQHWHVYVYPHINSPRERRQILHSGCVQDGAEALVQLLSDRIADKPIGWTWIPADPAHLFEDKIETLSRLYKEMPEEIRQGMETKRALWHDMLRVSGISPQGQAAPNRLFVTHSFLIAIARMVTHSLKHRTKDWKPMLKGGFAAWIFAWQRGEVWATDLWDSITQYDWRRRHGDVLRSLYERFVSEEDRKMFGEFYTPDWLAAMMVEEALDDEWLENAIQQADDAIQNGTPLRGTGVLDPACGSGTFLYHAARRMLKAPAMRDLQPAQKADVVALLVNGVDVHPVAVEIAKANLMRALPTEPTAGESAIRVYLGDSLQAGEKKGWLFDSGSMRLVTPKEGEILIPLEFVRKDGFDDSMRRLVEAAVAGKPVPLAVLNKVPESRRKDLENCRDRLADTIGKEGNSVWTWYATNIAAPYLLSERKVNRIVANPPWVKMAHLQEIERKRAMEAFGKTLGLRAGGKHAPHADIAAFFVLRTRELYMDDRESDPAIWLVKKSALHAGHWSRFREKHKDNLAQSIDLEALQPFGGGDSTRCCLLMEQRKLRSDASARRLEAQLRSPSRAKGPPKRPKPEEPWSVVQPRIRFSAVPNPLPQKPSEYGERAFRQGASISPEVLLVVESSYPQGNRIRVRTKKSRHHPWNKIQPQDIEIPKRWLSKLYKSIDMYPFLASLDGAYSIIPVDAQDELDLVSAQEEYGWKHLDEIYRQYRGKGRNTPKTLTMQIDFSGKLSVQPQDRVSLKSMVLYGRSGDILRAARTYPGAGIVNDTLNWRVADSAEEAGYLTALLNAPCLRRAFFESRESGRHFHLHPWRKIPIPRYDSKDKQHTELARLCEVAEKTALEVARKVRSETPTAKQNKLSKTIRQHLASNGISKAIDEVVARLLPDQAVIAS